MPGQEIFYPYFLRPIGGGNLLDTLVIFDDTATFKYDKTGNITLAENRDARVQRSYFANGSLKADTLRIARYTFVAAPAAPIWDGPHYIQTYEYDLSGRRTKRTDNNFGCSGCFQSYQYNTQSGFLDWTEDKGSSGGATVRFNFAYDEAGRVKYRFTNGDATNAKASVEHTYDADGQLTDRSVVAGATPGTSTVVYQDTHVYDARGKKYKTSSVSSLSDIAADYWESVYDGFGSLIGSGRKRNGNPTADINRVDALGNVLQRNSDSTMSVDAKHVDFSVVGDQISSAMRTPHLIDGSATDSTLSETYYDYDANGNQEKEDYRLFKARTPLPQSGLPTFDVPAVYGQSWQWMTYGRDNKLRYVQKSWYDPGGKRTVFTEYRYDALGRRILARTRRDTLCTGTAYYCQSTMDRFIWDGDQLIGESRGNGANTQSETLLNADGGTGDLQGWVRYTHAGGIDEPLAVWGGGASNAGVYGVVPHLSWRGNYEAGSNIVTGALLESGSPPWIWPTRYKDINLAPETRMPSVEPTRWLGSLVENQVDLNGLAYRRNRYYSPSTGRFTQEDPIGLAGGLNMYGFAEGDPINFSDPFGLMPCCFVDFYRLLERARIDANVDRLTGVISEGIDQLSGQLVAGGIGKVVAASSGAFGRSSGSARSALSRGPGVLPSKQSGQLANYVGFGSRVKDAPFNSHGQPVFSNGRNYITPDVDSHNGGVWKMFNRRGELVGTFDALLGRVK